MASVKVAEASRPLRSKGKFEAGERILCYEPDPEKVKVVYEAKILEIQIGKDDAGKRRNEYLVHFMGWSSTWDRFVLEDMLLKDTEENRNLQKELSKEADKIQNKKKKKTDRRNSDKSRLSCDGSEDAWREGSLVEDPDDTEIQFSLLRKEDKKDSDATDTITEPSSSPHKMNFLDELQNIKTEMVELDEPEDVLTEILPLNIPDNLKQKLEKDYYMINTRRKLSKLPAQPNIVSLLELFVRHYAIQKLAQLEKQLAKSPYNQYTKLNSEKETERYEEAMNQINVCKEVAEGVRIILDFQLGNILLYRREEEQFAKIDQITPNLDNVTNRPDSENGVTKPGRKHGVSESESLDNAVPGKKRTRLSLSLKDENGGLMPSSVGSTSSGTTTPTLPAAAGLPMSSGYPQSSKSHAILEQVMSWRLVPDTMYLEAPVPPSLVYGGIYIGRLMVKMPEIIAKMKFSQKNAKRIMKYLEQLTEFISNQELISDSYYQ